MSTFALFPDTDDAYMTALRRDPCAYCGGSSGVLDHIVPRAGGQDGWGNRTASCASCNSKKSTKSLLFALLHLRSPRSSRAAKPVAALLARLMAEHQLRAEDLAAELHISYRTITRWLSGKTEPTPTLARALGDRFGIDWRSLYADPDEKAAAA